MLNEPLIYRFYQRVMVYGTTFKELIQEGFGAASCRRSTSTWTWSARPATRATGRPAKLTISGKFPPHKSYCNNDDRPEYGLKS